MGEGAIGKELSSDPGDLCRAYEECIAALRPVRGAVDEAAIE